MNSNNRLQMAAKACKDLFAGKRYTQRAPEQALQNRTECPELAAQISETKPSASIFGSGEDVYPWAVAPLGKEQVNPLFMSQKIYIFVIRLLHLDLMPWGRPHPGGL